MGFSIELLLLLLLVAAVVALLARRLGIPYSVGLVVTGMVLAVQGIGANVPVTKEVIFNVLLPPLIFEAALFLPWKDLRPEMPVLVTMATVGVVLAAAVVAAGMHYIVDWPWISASIFGALIAATDPVAVIATFKEAGAKGRLRVLVEAESLFNDGTAAVLFGIIAGIAMGDEATVGGAAVSLIVTVGGGIACGGAVALAVLYLAGHTDEVFVEIMLTNIGAYGSFLLAEHFHTSGVLATLTAGLMIGSMGALKGLSKRGRIAVEAFWEYGAFVANSLIFLLLGMREAQQNFSGMWWPALVGVAVVTAGRAIAIYPVSAAFRQSRLRLSWSHQHILFWGGLRGALALALVLGLPKSIPMHDQIVTVSFVVVAFSILVQSVTVAPLLRRLGEIPG